MWERSDISVKMLSSTSGNSAPDSILSLPRVDPLGANLGGNTRFSTKPHHVPL